MNTTDKETVVYGMTMIGLLILVYMLPLWYLVKFAKRERKDWRIALVAGLFFTWLLAWLIVLVAPKLSDEDHERINGKAVEVRLYGQSGMKLPSPDFGGVDAWFSPVMWGLGIALACGIGMLAWLQWLV